MANEPSIDSKMDYKFSSFLMVVLIVVSALALIRFFNLQEQEQAPLVYVDHVIDGDTFIYDEHRIRLWGINAPELDELYFETSRLYLESLIGDRVIKCVWKNNDKYKREAMRCKLDDVDIGEAMVRAGLAKDLPSYSSGFYQRAQKDARNNKKGIWKNWSG